MSNYSNTKATIAANVYTNHNNEVTAEMVKAGINAVVDTLIAGGFIYKGVATTSTNPGSPDANVFYIATAPGTYTNFGSLVVADGEVAILKYNGSWSKEVTGAATAAEVTALGHEVNRKVTAAPGDNLLDINSPNIIDGKYLNNIGNLADNVAYEVSDYIPCEPSTQYYISGESGGTELVLVASSGVAVCYYDSNWGYLSAETGSSSKRLFTTHAGAAFMRVSMKKDNLINAMVEKGNKRGAYNIYNPVYGYVADLSAKTDKKVDISIGDNLLDLNSPGIIDNKYINNVGNLADNVAYEVSDYIPCKASTQYYISGESGGTELVLVASSGASVAYYDADKTYLSCETGGTSKKLFTTPASAAFMRVTMKKENLIKAMVEKGTARGKYNAYNPIGGYLGEVNQSLAKIEQSASPLGTDAQSVFGNMASGDTLTLPGFPYHCVVGVGLSFYAAITTFSKIYIGKGIGQYRGRWFEIDNTNIVFKGYELAEQTISTKAHGLTISTFIGVCISVNRESKCKITIMTLGGMYSDIVDFEYCGNYAAFVKSDGSTLTGCKFSATLSEFSWPVWAIGDSYFGVANNRWPGQLKNIGYYNYLNDHLAGINSTNSLADLQRLLNLGIPKYLLWCSFGNDYANLSTAIANANAVLGICDQMGITPILATLGNMPDRDYTTWNTFVYNSGRRYIDFSKAVGSPVYQSGVNNWFPGYLSVDNVHPTELGAKALAMQVLEDFPEIMQYGLYNTDTSFDE